MTVIKSVTLIIFVLNLWKCEDILPLFKRIISLEDSFNTSILDNLYGDFKINERYWKLRMKGRNISTDCQNIRYIAKNTSNVIVHINNGFGQTALSNYLITKMLKMPCSDSELPGGKKRPSFTKIWIYGFLTVTLNNLLAVLGVFFIPLIRKKIYNKVMTFMVSLAIGALAGTSILILIPDAMQIGEIVGKTDHDKNDYKWKATVVFAGLYMFFVTERILKIFTHYKNPSTICHDAVMKFEITKITNDELRESFSKADSSFVHQQPHKRSNEIAEQDRQFAEEAKKTIAPVAWMIILGDAVHNFVDGLSIGAGFSQSIILGISISLAVLCEELPHELGDFAVLLTGGMSPKQAVFWNLISAMTCYLGFIFGAISGEVGQASVWIFAVAGGMFLYISLVDMMNNIIETIDDMVATWKQKAVTFAIQNCGLWTGYITILVLALYGDRIKIEL